EGADALKTGVEQESSLRVMFADQRHPAPADQVPATAEVLQVALGGGQRPGWMEEPVDDRGALSPLIEFEDHSAGLLPPRFRDDRRVTVVVDRDPSPGQKLGVVLPRERGALAHPEVALAATQRPDDPARPPA